MPIQHAVLSLLAAGPSYGYELKSAFEAAVGPQWGTLNIGHLYQVLDRLLRDGLATAQVMPQHDRPDRTVYEISDRGRAELQQWLDSPTDGHSDHRDDFVLKVMAASRQSAAHLRSVVRIELGRQQAELDHLIEERAAQAGNALVVLLLDAAIDRVRAGLRFAETAELRADELAATTTRTDEFALPLTS
jgi:DNA-binding PadR family transcriptional regulator